MMVGELVKPAATAEFADLYRREHQSMVRLARLIVGSMALAEELVHDAFIVVFQRHHRLDNPGAYLRQVVVNNCRSSLRRSTTGRRKVSELADGTPGDAFVSLPPELDETWQSLHVLNIKQRTALVLRFYLDLPVKEIAEIMGVREGTVKSTIHRGLTSLRQELET